MAIARKEYCEGMLGFESWDAGGRDAYLYTEERRIARELTAEFPCPSVCFRHNSPFACQFLIPSRLLPLLSRRYQSRVSLTGFEVEDSEKLSVETKGVTAG